MKQVLLSLLIAILLPQYVQAQAAKLQAFPLTDVQLLESPFQKAQQVDLNYILALDPDRLLVPFRREAGLETKAQPYGNWENTGLDGHIGGHYLTALALMYASTGQEELRRRLNYMIDQLEACQQKNGNGYIGGIPGGEAMWQEVARGNIRAGAFDLNRKWVPWYNIHKLYAGLRDAYLFAGNAKAKTMLIALSDWCLKLTAGLSDQQIQDMLRSEHGGMNEVFADVAAITGDKKYLELAKRFSHRSVLDPLLEKQDRLNGMHANTQIPKVIGYKRVAEVGGDPRWADAAAFFWETVVGKRTVSIGGNSVREHFHPASDFSSMVESREGPETCNTYNMLKLSRQLYLTSASTDYLDYYERALYNHILSSQHPEKGGFVYFTPMRPRHYRVYSQPEAGFWCCVGSGLENHGKYGELIYAHDKANLFVNLFIPSELTWREQGLRLRQQTRFPYEESTSLTLQLKKARRFVLHIRRPDWVSAGKFALRVNGKTVKTSEAGGYVAIARKWKPGDVVSVNLPMETKAEYLPNRQDWVSFVHGPIVLAAATDRTDLAGLWADGSRMGHIANGPLYPVEEGPMVLARGGDLVNQIRPVPGKPLTFTASSLIAPGKYQHVELVPFFNVHEARYVVYWPVTTPEQLAKSREALRLAEAARLALEARTVDQVAPGEQQPESDHGYQGEQSESGVHRDRHWRHSAAWFSYHLRNPQKEARKLRITYYGLDKDRSFDILVNNILVAKVNLDGAQGDQFFDVDYDLPASVLQSAGGKNLNLKFVAHPGSVAGGIYYVRLLK